MAFGVAARGGLIGWRIHRHRRHAVYRLSVVGRPDREGEDRRTTCRGCCQAARPMDLAPPAKSPTSWGGDRYFGDAELREWIEQYRPDIVLSGHVHQSPFVKNGSWVDRIGPTWVFNAGQQFGAPPTHIIIDTDEGEALWFSAAGGQFVRLEAPLERPVPQLKTLPDWFTAADRLRLPGQA